MSSISPSKTNQQLPDIQSTGDNRRVAINKVGVTNIRYPISLRTPGEGQGEYFSAYRGSRQHVRIFTAHREGNTHVTFP